MKNNSIYLDHASSRSVLEEVFNFAKPYIIKKYGNPSSLYNLGLESQTALEEAREKIRSFINAENSKNIIFTNNATESNNIAIKGTAIRNLNDGKEIISSSIEHMSVINPMKDLQKNGWTYNQIPVDKFGFINSEKLNELLSKKTIVTSIMYANNEIGTIQPIKKISGIVHDKGKYLHVDASAAIGYLPVDVQRDDIDLLSFSSNDIYGPRGAGILYIKPGVKLQSIMPGGGQERGIKSGTENIFSIAGMGEASKIMKNGIKSESERLTIIRNKLIIEISKIDRAFLTGHPKKRLPGHVSFIFNNIEGESILLNMDMYNIQIATGSACSHKTLEPSHVLLEIGLKHEEAHGSMVMTLGKSNNIDQIPLIVKAVNDTVERLRKLSPLSDN
ncbi:cysteine desulfurase family protein [Thermoplasmatota archaeon]